MDPGGRREDRNIRREAKNLWQMHGDSVLAFKYERAG